MPRGPGGVIILANQFHQIQEPQTKRAIAFVDGQNLYHHARAAFNVSHPNYDVLALTRKICQSKGWFFKAARFYTGMPELADDPKWHNFWTKKLLAIKRQGVHVYSRRLRYREQEVIINGTSRTVTVGEEKGIDIRIALDCVSLALSDDLDVAVIFSQDQDMSEVVDEIKKIARLQRRWIKVACAYPTSPTASNRRGINGSEWIQFDEAVYRTCIDARDYR
jgi:uncharacterized LabA/DUF88 family protein